MSQRASLAIAAGVMIGAAAWWYQRQAQAGNTTADSGGVLDSLGAAADDAGQFLKVSLGDFMPFSLSVRLAANLPYVNACRAAEIKHGLPADLLTAQIYQESHFNPKAINKSSGAQGIAQFMPATAQWLGLADPFEPFTSIDMAGRYMAMLYKQAGSWKGALAAYNWGIGNLTRKGMAKAPAETRNYVASISNNSGLSLA